VSVEVMCLSFFVAGLGIGFLFGAFGPERSRR
jgi:hypothetical protein